MGVPTSPSPPPSPKASAAAGRSAFAILVLALAGSAAGAALVVERRPAAAAIAVAVVALALAGASAAARSSGDRRALLGVRLMDPVFDAALLGAIAWGDRIASPRVAAVALVALGCSFVAGYERTRAQSLRYAMAEGVPFRLARPALVAIGLGFGWLEPVLWAYAAAGAATMAVRGMQVARQTRRDPDGRLPSPG